MAERIQLSRRKGWRMPENTVSVARPGKWGNPFRVGGYFMLGDPDPLARALRMAWCEAHPDYADSRFTLIEDNATAVDFFKRLMATSTRNLSELRGKNLACWCKPGQPCHADVLLELANAPETPMTARAGV